MLAASFTTITTFFKERSRCNDYDDDDDEIPYNYSTASRMSPDYFFRPLFYTHHYLPLFLHQKTISRHFLAE